jgi:hypothetical protein
MLRALVLLSILALLACGAYLYHQVRFTHAATPDIAPVGAGKSLGDIVFQLGGAPPKAAPAPAEVAPAEPPVKSDPVPSPGPAAPPKEDVKPPKSETPPSPPQPAALPAGASTATIGKGETLYSIAVKYYGSGAPAVRKDVAAASRISDETKIREGTVLTLPAVAGGKRRK